MSARLRRRAQSAGGGGLRPVPIQTLKPDISCRVTSVATKPSPSRSRAVENFAVVWQTRNGAESSNPVRSTLQSPRRRTSRRIDRNPRVCARFAIERGPRERLYGSDSPKSANSSLGAICLGPRIIAFGSPGRSWPAFRVRRPQEKQHVGGLRDLTQGFSPFRFLAVDFGPSGRLRRGRITKTAAQTAVQIPAPTCRTWAGYR
jgi:hypothetical protein